MDTVHWTGLLYTRKLQRQRRIPCPFLPLHLSASPPPTPIFFSSSLSHPHQWNCSMSRLLTCMRWQERLMAASTTSRVMRPGDGTYLVHLAP